MQKSLLIVLFFLATLSPVKSQKSSYNFKLYANYPFITTVEKSPIINAVPISTSGFTTVTSGQQISENYASKPGGTISGNITYALNAKVFFEAGLQIDLIRFRQQTKTSGSNELLIGVIDTSNVIFGGSYGGIITEDRFALENSDKLGNTTTLYTSIPLKIGYSFFHAKFKCKIGITTSFLAYAEVYTYNYTNFTQKIIKDKSADGFSNLMWNGNIELEYLVYNNIGLSLNYSRSLNSIYDEDISLGNPNYNIFSIGLTYNFLK